MKSKIQFDHLGRVVFDGSDDKFLTIRAEDKLGENPCMILEVGKKYVNRKGDVITIVKALTLLDGYASAYKFRGVGSFDFYDSFTSDGCFWGSKIECDQDLVRLYEEKTVDIVNQPPHYKQGDIETIDIIEAWKLPYHLGNTVKYISRAGKKDASKELEDLKKARWYLDRYISNLENKKDGE